MYDGSYIMKYCTCCLQWYVFVVRTEKEIQYSFCNSTYVRTYKVEFNYNICIPVTETHSDRSDNDLHTYGSH